MESRNRPQQNEPKVIALAATRSINADLPLWGAALVGVLALLVSLI